jgi:hypothetical protein
MRRRELVAVIGLGAVTGCVSSGGGAGGSDDTESPTETESPTPTETASPTATESPTPTATDSPTPTERPTTITDTTLKQKGDCAESESGTASVAFASGQITVQGCIRGRYGCSIAKLRSVEYDETKDRLNITVETKKDGAVCSQQIVYRSYAVRATVEGAMPGTVAVSHADKDDVEVVTTASP